MEVGYLRRLAGLASLEDWRGSCLCSESISSVTERSALFVKESSHRWHQTDDVFSTETGPERVGISRPVRCLWTLSSSAKIRNKKDLRGSPIASLMPKLIIFGGREDQLLRE